MTDKQKRERKIWADCFTNMYVTPKGDGRVTGRVNNEPFDGTLEELIELIKADIQETLDFYAAMKAKDSK